MTRENYINTLELDNAELKKENAMLTQALKDTERTAFEIKYELEKENKKLEGVIQTYKILLKTNIEENKKLLDTFVELKTRNNTAMKYIELHTNGSIEYLDTWEAEELLNILKGGKE